MKVRLADVAAHAGVSEATVSRVLNRRAGVAPATCAVVLTALDSLGYERRPSARASGLVGLIVPGLDDPDSPSFAQAVEIALVRHGYAPVLCTLSPGVHEHECVALLQQRGVAGIIVMSGTHALVATSPTRYARLREQGLPLVLVNGYLQGVDAPFISNDDATSIELAVSHLVELGHRRIGLATEPRRYTSSVRKISAFHTAVRQQLNEWVSPGEVDSLIETTFFGVDGGLPAAQALLDRGVTAVVCGSDLTALAAVRAARDRGLRVPQDVSVVGSGGAVLVGFTDPPLTTVRQPMEAMAAAAVHALVHEIDGTPAPRAEYLFRPELVVRGSTARAPRGAPGGISAPPSQV